MHELSGTIVRNLREFSSCLGANFGPLAPKSTKGLDPSPDARGADDGRCTHGGWRLRPALPRLLGVAVAIALGPAAAAGAHGVTAMITPPAIPVVEDSGFPMVFSGDVTSLGPGGGYIRARIRPAGGPPCAPDENADPGTAVDFGGAFADSIEGPFRSVGSYVADEPRDYLICAWVLDALGETGPPSAAMVTVRPPVLRIAIRAPATARTGRPFTVRVDYQAEVPRYLTVLVVRSPGCSRSGDALLGLTVDSGVVADDAEVSGIGSLTSTVRLARPGRHLVCGFLDENISGSAVAQLVAPAATVAVARPLPRLRSCGSAGGRRAIHSVRARSVPCAAAKRLARRWGARRAPRRVGAYRCVARSGAVTCTGGAAQVRFRYRR